MTAKNIQFTSGCPNNCSYCYEPKEIKTFNPEIPRDKDINILDMNFLSNPNVKEILYSLPKRRYELICGLDFRLLTQEIADLLREKGFIKIRWAWDYSFNQQKKHKATYIKLIRAGYKPKDLSVFILVNWRIPFTDCCRKLDLLKVWGIKVNDCCFNGGYKIAKPQYWNIEQIKEFRRLCRKHNQLVRFGLDPENCIKNNFKKCKTKSLKEYGD